MKVRVHTTVDFPVEPSDLRDWRKAKGYSLRYMADLLGVTNSYWSKVERGDREPGFETMQNAILLLTGRSDFVPVKYDPNAPLDLRCLTPEELQRFISLTTPTTPKEARHEY